MRTATLIAAVLPAAALVAACHRSPRSADDAAMQRDLKLAATATLNLATPPVNPANFRDLETAPPTELRPAAHLVKAPGPRAIRSATPTLRAAEIPQVAATTPMPQAQTVSLAPVPVVTLDPVASAPRPGDAPRMPAVDAAGTAGRGQAGSGWAGPGIGVIIRGGGLDGDHCEPHGRGNVPIPGVFLPGPGDMGGGTRFPVIRPRGGTTRY
ncbi:MAG: hypothetical protein KGL38_15990 [Gemmatimonadota bacterium]|nr:hypothetical protein [Gemmatimonadota bacterium]MDE3129509.1 hypothetical protein [Gemmatimonadota bacterium]MDE3173546.1 hypothetical protein [Gemmatimonadota bacterium]MDE3214895.1 hypothetical protein [Gemmatimonadota bacterium]